MKTALKIILGLVVIGGLTFYWFISKLTDAYSPTYNRIELVSTGKQKLFIKTKNWGVTGDHQMTIITTDDQEEFIIDSTKQVIFKGLDPFLYKVSSDTLFLTLRQKSRIPANFKSHWTIIQTEVDNPTMMNSMTNLSLKRP